MDAEMEVTQMVKTSETKTPQTPVFRCYARCSHESQIDGLGLDAQKTSCRKYVKEQNGRIIQWYMDEGISGAKDIHQRPALEQLLKDVQPGEVVLVARKDRLSRDFLVTASITRCLQKVNATIQSADGVANSDSPADEMLRMVLMGVASYERGILSERVKVAMGELNRKVGRLPYGYKWDKSGRQVKDPKTYSNLERILELRAEGLGPRKIAKMLDAENIKPQRSKQWNPSSVFRLIQRVDGNRPCGWDARKEKVVA